jgi:hypothetical protein
MQARSASYSGGAAYARMRPSTMAADDSPWSTSGEVNVACLRSTAAYAVLTGTCLTTAPRSLQFMDDDGEWQDAPVLTGQTSFPPQSGVKREGFM